MTWLHIHSGAYAGGGGGGSSGCFYMNSPPTPVPTPGLASPHPSPYRLLTASTLAATALSPSTTKPIIIVTDSNDVE